MDLQRRVGIILITVALAFIPITLLTSNGYQPQHGLLTSLYYSMTLVDTYVCEDGIEATAYNPRPDDCTHISIATRYLVVLLLMLATYGFLVYKSVVPIPMRRSKDKPLPLDGPPAQPSIQRDGP